MNKFKFLLEQEKITSDVVSQYVLPYKDFSKFYDFQFVSTHSIRDLRYNLITGQSYGDEQDMTHRSRTGGMIDKTAIQDSVAKQFKAMKLEIKNCGEILLYLRMNKATKGLFRMYHSYEVDLVPRNLSQIDKGIGKIIGSIEGIKIVQDEGVQTNRVLPVVSREVKNKFEKIF